MRPRRIASISALLALLGLAGCGGGSGSSGHGASGSLHFRALWQQPDPQQAGVVNARAVSDPSIDQAQGSGFGSEIPASVRRARVIFTSDSGFRCCVSFDPRSEIFSQKRLLVLSDLPEGGATVTLSGYATNFAPDDGITEQCQTNPEEAGQPCISTAATPSFASEPKSVTVLRGVRSNAGDLEVFSFPFLIPDSLAPPPGNSVQSPLTIAFTVGDAASTILSDSFEVTVSQFGAPSSPPLPVESTPCDDSGAAPCDEAGAYGVRGFQVTANAGILPDGPLHVELRASNVDGRDLAFGYDLTILPGGPSTPTSTPTVPPSPSLTGTRIPTTTPTFSPTSPPPSTHTPTISATVTTPPSPSVTPPATPSATRVATASPTRSSTSRPTVSATATMTTADTPTRTATRTQTATVVPQDTPTVTATLRATATRTPTSTRSLTATSTRTPSPTLSPSATATPVQTNGVISGTVVNCLTGAPISGALVQLSGVDSDQFVTGTDGVFSFSTLKVGVGVHELDTSASGFVSSSQEITLDQLTPQRDVPVAICPVGSAAALRIVLTWGSAPPAPDDLDSHLRGPIPGASGEFHVYYNDPSITFTDGSSATLDIDDTTFGGPETTSVSRLTAGLYRYCVHDYTNADTPGALGLMNSSARVQVFLDETQIGTFNAPSLPGTVWSVFTLDTTQQPPKLNVVNTLSDQADSDLVCDQAVHPAAAVDR